MKFRLQPQKTNSITKKNSVSFTNRRWPMPNYNVCCVTRQYFFTIYFFASQRLSEGPTCLYNYIYLLLSSFFFKYKLFEDLCHSQSRWFTTKYYVTKRKSPHCFDQRISRAFPGNLHKSFKTIFGCPNWKREWIKINNTKNNWKNRYLHFCFCLPKAKTEKHYSLYTDPTPPASTHRITWCFVTKYSVFTSCLKAETFIVDYLFKKASIVITMIKTTYNI